jgi:hypothetical protein
MVALSSKAWKAQVRFGLSGTIAAVGLIAILIASASARDLNAGLADFFSAGAPRPPRAIPGQRPEHAATVQPKPANAPMHQAQTAPQSARETRQRPSAMTFPPVTPLE